MLDLVQSLALEIYRRLLNNPSDQIHNPAGDSPALGPYQQPDRLRHAKTMPTHANAIDDARATAFVGRPRCGQ